MRYVAARKARTPRGWIAISTLLILFCQTPISASAQQARNELPFAPNPKSFAEYMSKQSFQGKGGLNGKSKFLDLSGCSFGRWKNKRREPLNKGDIFQYDGEPNPYVYSCRHGYAQQQNPMGTQVCEISDLYHGEGHMSVPDDLFTYPAHWVRETTSFSTVRCIYK